MVHGAGQTELESSKLAFRSGMDRALRSHGRGGLAGVEETKYSRHGYSYQGLLVSPAPQYSVVFSFLRASTARSRSGWDCRSVGSNFLVTGAVLATRPLGGSSLGTLSGLGDVCHGSQFRNLASQLDRRPVRRYREQT